MDKEEYRSGILSLSSDMLNADSLKSRLIRSKFQELTKYAFEDLDTYIRSIDISEKSYFYDAKISQYLNLANNIKDKPFAERFTSRLMAGKIRGWMGTQAVTARIFNELETDKKEISGLLDSMDTRFSIMKALHKANRFVEVPKKYRNQAEFAKLCFYETLSYDDEAPDEIKLLGHIMSEGSKVYVFSFSYQYEPNEKLIGLSGFYPSSQKSLSNEDPLSFDGYLSYSPWEFLEKDWKTQAKSLIPDLKEYGY